MDKPLVWRIEIANKATNEGKFARQNKARCSVAVHLPGIPASLVICAFVTTPFLSFHWKRGGERIFISYLQFVCSCNRHGLIQPRIPEWQAWVESNCRKAYRHMAKMVMCSGQSQKKDSYRQDTTASLTDTSPCTYAIKPPSIERYARWCER